MLILEVLWPDLCVVSPTKFGGIGINTFEQIMVYIRQSMQRKQPVVIKLKYDFAKCWNTKIKVCAFFLKNAQTLKLNRRVFSNKERDEYTCSFLTGNVALVSPSP